MRPTTVKDLVKKHRSRALSSFLALAGLRGLLGIKPDDPGPDEGKGKPPTAEDGEATVIPQEAPKGLPAEGDPKVPTETSDSSSSGSMYFPFDALAGWR